MRKLRADSVISKVNRRNRHEPSSRLPQPGQFLRHHATRTRRHVLDQSYALKAKLVADSSWLHWTLAKDAAFSCSEPIQVRRQCPLMTQSGHPICDRTPVSIAGKPCCYGYGDTPWGWAWDEIWSET
jgi:hypothetical protein